MESARSLIVFSWLIFPLISFSSPPSALALPEAERLWLVGEQAFQDKLYSLANKNLERFVLRYPQDSRFPDAVLLLGKARLATGQAEPALESFRQAQRFPAPPGKDGEAKFWEAEALFRLKRYGEAASAYERVISAGSSFAPDASYGLAWCQLQEKHTEKAVRTFQTLLDRWPTHAVAAGATYHLARLHAEAKHHAEAVALLGGYATRFPDSPFLPEAAYLLGWSAMAGGESEAAASTLKEFVARYPTHELARRARSDLVELLLRQGKKAEVEQEVQTLLAAKSPTPEGLSDAALFAQKIGRQKDTESAWRKLRQEFPQHPLAQQASLELARLAFDRRDFKESASSAERAAQSEDAAVRLEALTLLGESELKQKRQKPALKAFQSAVDLGLTDSPLHYRAVAGAGLAHEALKEWALASKAYELVARASPDRALKEWAGKRLAQVRDHLKPPSKATPQKSSSPKSTGR